MTTIKTTVRNRRIDVPAPNDIPDGVEVTLMIAESEEDSLPPEEIVAYPGGNADARTHGHSRRGGGRSR